MAAMAAIVRGGRRLLAQRTGLLRGTASSARFTQLYPRWQQARLYTNSPSSRQDMTAFHSQVSDPSAAAFLHKTAASSPVPQTLTEKIVQKYSLDLPPGKFVKSGDYVTLQPHHCMTHDNSWPVATKFMSIGASKIHDNRQVVMTLDHDVQNKSEKNLQKYRNIENFAGAQGVDFYPAGRGIGHQIMVEEGYAFPSTLCVASDSHTNTYGAVGCLGTPVVRTDAASIWATGRTWWQIPPIALVTFKGVLPPGVTGKDVIVALCGLFNKDDVLNHAIEFQGSEQTLRSLPVDDRLAIANMTTEWGALSGLFPIDSILQAWLRAKATETALFAANSETAKRFSHQRLEELFENPLKADFGATYAKKLYLDLSTLAPYVSGPNSVKVATPLPVLAQQQIPINKAYLVSCTNSRRSDIAAAAKVFKDAAAAGKPASLAPGVKMYIAAASMLEQQAAEEQGDWQALLDAGATPLPSGCGPCIGLGTGLLEPGEVGISASNRNFKGRMGSTEAKAYLASPEVVAASALSGQISGPGWYNEPANYNGVVLGDGDGIAEDERMISIEDALDKIVRDAENMIAVGESSLTSSSPSESASTPSTDVEETLTDLLPGFPEKISGELVLCDADNVNTDAIYPGKYTYQDDVPVSKMAEVCMENYDRGFRNIAKAGDILVSGFNFGCGSSREQAATAILAKGMPLVVAGSFGNIFSRNSINNALPLLEVPKLINRLRQAFAASPAPHSQTPAAQQQIHEPQRNKESLDSPPPAPVQPMEKQLTQRTGWHLEWDLRRSKVTVTEADGSQWSQKVGELPPNVQAIVARGGLEKWVKAEIGA